MPLRSSTIFFSAISACLALPLMMAGQEHSITEKSSVGGDPRSNQQSEQSTQPLQQSSSFVKQEVHHDVSPPLLLIPPPPRQPGLRIHAIGPIPRHYQPPAADPVLQPNYPTPLAPLTTLNFDGVGNGFTGPSGTFTVQGAPPDTEGDVGPNHYVQIVNTDFAIFNKSGTAIFGPVPINTLWQGFGGLCQTDNDGDPVVIYDPIADRWVISQFAVSGANGTSVPFLQCVAVSQTPDPAGAYNRYSFAYSSFNDYPKMGVWPDAYYITFNFFNPSLTAFLGGEVCAYDRTSMLAGQPATQQCFNVGTNYGGLLPADLDGSQLPPAGSPNYVLALGVSNNDLAFWKFHVDWTTPANTTLTGPATITVATYTAACSGGTCIPQSGTSQQLDSLADRLMFRLAYRNFGSHESLVANHSVAAGSGVGVRWYEIRSPGTTPTIFQQGTYAPDSNYRWMGSIAMDQNGDMALGFSLSGSSLHPGIHYTGRLVGDPLGQMTQGEGTIIDGAGSQTTNLSRWGDYSMMGIDPSDDCTFWYTNEYIPSNGIFNWKTRIGSFKFPNCGVPPPPDFSLSTTPASMTVTAGSPASYTENVTATGGFTGSVSLSISGLPAGASGTFNPNPVTGASSALTITTSSTTPVGTYVFTVTGTSTSPALTHTSTATLVVQGPPDFSLSTTPSSATVIAGSPASYTENITATGGFAGSVSLSISGLPAGANGTFNPNPATGASSALTITTSSTTPVGTYVFTVTGTSTSPALTHTSTATLVVQSSGPPPSIAFVRAANNLIPTSAASVSVANMINNVGDTLVVACRESAQITITSVTDTAGNSYTKIANAFSTGRESALFFAANIKASSANTITCNFASTTGREAMVVEEFSGVVAPDGSVTASNNSATTSLPSGNLATTNAKDLLVYEVNVGADSTFTAGPGYVIPAGGSNARLAMQFAIVSSQGTYSTLESWSTAALADGIFAALAGPAAPPTPSITSLTPNIGPVGNSITIAGANFGSSQGVSTVTFNGTLATPTSWSNTSIAAPVPMGATDGNVVVTVGGVASNGVSFTVAPAITSLNPSSAPVGYFVTISGTSFGVSQGTSIVGFNGTTTTPTNWSATSIIAPVPTGAISGPVVVILGNGVSSNAVNFTVAPPSPVITSLSPTSGVAGTPVTVTGIGFGTSQSSSRVTFNGATASITSWSTGSINTLVPAGAATGNVVVTVGGVPSNGSPFTVLPSISSLSPNSGSVGMSVTILGNAFGPAQGTSTVVFNGIAATPTFWSSSNISVPVPTGATTGNVVVTVGGVASNGVPFTVVVDTTPPTAPTNLTATAISAGQINLSWTASTDDVGVTGYLVERCQGVGCANFTQIFTIPGTNTSLSDLGVVAGTSYTYRVRATDAAGNLSSYSNTASATTPSVAITNLNPTSGPVGTSVTITGTNFGASQGTSTVTFNGTAATPTSWSATSIVVPVPASATSGNVIVTVGGVPSNNVFFTVMPTITNLSPSSGPVTTSVTITGTSFGASQGSSTVTFNGVSAGVANTWSATSIVVSVPNGATSGNVLVIVGGAASNGMAFTVTPGIFSLSPTSGPAGTSVTISGSNFGTSQGTSTVTFNGTLATPTSWSATGIVVPVPSGATTGNVVVTVSGQASNGVSFTVIPTPSIASLSPTSGPIGAGVTITGTNFGATQGNNQVTFNGTAATPTSWSATSIVVSVPAGASTGNVLVFVNGVFSNAVSFTVTPVTITSIAPPAGPVGTLVTISGTNFGPTQGTSTVTFNGVIATVQAWNSTGIGTLVPSGATTGNVVVTVGGVASNAVPFTVAPPPSISSLSPMSGPVGTSVTITGTNFGASQGTSTVTFNGGMAGTPTSWGATSIVVPVPTGATTGGVYVTVGGVASNIINFTVTPPPDFSLSTSPSSVTVTAGSPASYTENITATGGFTGSVSLSISGLPAGANGTFNPNPATGASSALTITTSSTTPVGSYVFTVTGTSTSPALTHTSTATLVVQSSGPPPSITFVRAANNLIPTSAASVSVANMVNNVGDMLVVACRESAQITITSVTDTAGNSYTKIATAFSTGRESALFFAANIKASSANTISCNFASTTGREAMVVEEFSGVVALDGSVTANSNSATTSLPSGNLATANAHDLLVYEVNLGADSTFTAGPGYVIPAGGSNARLAMQFTIVSLQGTYATLESWSTAAPADGIFAAFK